MLQDLGDQGLACTQMDKKIIVIIKPLCSDGNNIHQGTTTDGDVHYNTVCCTLTVTYGQDKEAGEEIETGKTSLTVLESLKVMCFTKMNLTEVSFCGKSKMESLKGVCETMFVESKVNNKN